MKIIHCSDLHLDADLRSRFDAGAAAERRAELMNTFRRLCRKAQETGVSAVLICGDLFDTDAPSASAVRAVEDLILTYSGILFFYLRGNHDGSSVLFRTREKPDNLCLFGDDWTSRELEEAAGVAGTAKGADAGADAAGADAAAARTAAGPALARRRIRIVGREPGRPLTSPTLDPACLNIVMLHGQIREGRSASDPDSIPLGLLRGTGIDYLALGHLHSYRSFPLDDRGTAAYAGCLEGRGFDECGECGYVLLDTDTASGRIDYRFVPFAERRIYRVLCDVTGCLRNAEVYDRISNALSSSPAQEKDLVRLELTGGLEYGCSPSPALVRGEWEDRFHYFDYTDNTSPVVHSEDFVCDATLKGEFVRVVSAAEGLDDTERARILRCGLRALSGETLFP